MKYLFMKVCHCIGQMIDFLNEEVALLKFSEHRWRFNQFYNNLDY